MKQYSTLQNMGFVLKGMAEYNKKIFIEIILFVLTSILLPIQATLISTITVNMVTREAGAAVPLAAFVVVITALSAAYLLVSCVKTYCFDISDYKNSYVRMSIYQMGFAVKTIDTDYDNIESSSGQLRYRKAFQAINSNWVGVELMMKNIPPMAINLIGILAYAGLIVSIDIRIVAILFAMSAAHLALSEYARRYENAHKDECAVFDQKQDYLYKKSVDAVNGKDARMYRMEKWFYQIFHELIKQRVNWYKKTEKKYLLPDLSDSIFLFLRDGLAYYILITGVIGGRLSITEFTFYTGIIAGFSNWLNGLVTACMNMQKASLRICDLRTYLELEDRKGKGGRLASELETPLTITFEDVSFRYPGSDNDAVSHMNLTIHAGERIALVGSNGAGKTTLVKLLCGFYAPTSGRICINGIPVDEFDHEEYYKLLGVVFQDALSVALPIAQNVSCTTPEQVDDKRLWECLATAGIADKIKSLPKKEWTSITQILDPNGVNLSGGQLQHMFMARLLYKDAPLLILDEPTSALDPLAEAQMYEQYNELTRDKTSIFISHRLASTRFCDRILMIDRGRIVQEGSHEQLLNQQGLYNQMFEIQSHYYKEHPEVQGNE